VCIASRIGSTAEEEGRDHIAIEYLSLHFVAHLRHLGTVHAR